MQVELQDETDSEYETDSDEQDGDIVTFGDASSGNFYRLTEVLQLSSSKPF